MRSASSFARFRALPGCRLVNGYGPTENTTFTTCFTIREDPGGLATIPIGYHDGLPRALSNAGHFLVNGRRAPIIGRMSMDWTTIDVTDIHGALIGDEVTILGQSGNEIVIAEDFAALADTISYEITCGISQRIPRRY